MRTRHTVMRPTRSAGAISLILMVAPATAQTDSIYCLAQQTQAEIGSVGSTTDLYRDGDTIYVLDRAEKDLLRFDVSDPLSPVLEGEWITANTPNAVHVEYPYAYIATDHNGLRILDLSLASGYFVSYTPTPGEAMDLHYKDGMVYIADEDAGLTIADVTDPHNVQIMSTLSLPGSAVGIDLTGQHAVVACSGGGLRVVDVSDPHNPAQVGAFTPPHTITSLAISGDYAYAGTSFNSVLYTVDLSDPTQPAQLSAEHLPNSWVYGVSVDSGYLLVSNGSSGVRVYDLHDPASPDEFLLIPSAGNAHDATIANGYLFSADGPTSGFRRALLRPEPRSPLVRRLHAESNFRTVLASGDMLYVGSDEPALNLYSIADPGFPQLVSSIGLADRPLQMIEAAQGTLIVAVDDAGVQIVDVSDPAAPMIVSGIATPSRAVSLHLNGPHLYIGCEQGIQVADISDLHNPALVGQSQGSSSSMESLAASGGYLFSASGYAGLQAFDLSNPVSPVLIGQLDLDFMFDYADDIEVRDGVAYLSATDSISIIDVSDPSAPQYLSEGIFGLSGRYLSVQWPYLFVNYFTTELNVFDASDPQSPLWLGSYITPGSGYNQEFVFHNGYAYLTKSYDGLLVLDAGEGCDRCLADIDQDGGFSFFDVSLFISSFADNTHDSDLNLDGSWDFFDVSLFLNRIDDGCDETRLTD